MKRTKILILSVIAAAAVIGACVYKYWYFRDPLAARTEMLALVPPDTNLLAFLDLTQFRSSLFLAELLAWAPRPAPDTDYMQFVQATGFNFERDLDRLVIARIPGSSESSFLAIGDGHFNRKKIETYAQRVGQREVRDGQTLYAVRVSGFRTWFFTFWGAERVAWTNDPSGDLLLKKHQNASEEWRERFVRLAGTPVFMVIHQDLSAISALAQRVPGGFRSPQLVALLGQLQWISISGKPDGTLLRMVIDAECFSQPIIRQLREVLNGIIMLAETGLNSPTMRKQLDPQLRDGCVELLHSAEVQESDHGSTSSVRLIFSVTPKLLRSAGAMGSGADPPPPAVH